ncbi:hypothetical protein CDD82_5262 [Ophiocordyceps australis]|uniref:Mediator of RNA polymerase II transcription subunit 1 n=1 Tax=Ophiocordyceps australis TaxID=1399860 RepID=A0A2C5YYH8_9HYPO|nr:hypothetical protein CDD82_5262 [Ophiocordyceps australis]
MATPTPIKHAPSQQGRTPSQLPVATPPVSTPFSNPPLHAAFSPRPPKSSPQQVKKSPAASNLTAQASIGAAFNFDSPSTVAAMGALGMGAAFDMTLDNVALAAPQTGEEDIVKRLDGVTSLLQTKGYVSTASLERLAQRLGLELLSEERIAPGGRKTTTLAIAGSAIALEIVLDNNIVLSSSLSYHGSAASVSRHIDAASRILANNLQLAPAQSPLTKTLDAFATNFERLAMLDKLSILPALDCHEALAGIFQSLERVYNWNTAQMRHDAANATRSPLYIDNLVMCAGYGVPVMHARNRLGLALQYWKDLRFLPPDAKTASYAHHHENIWSLLLGCAPMTNLSVPPVRVSDNWIAKDAFDQPSPIAPAAGLLSPLAWLNPPDVSLPQPDDKDSAMNLLQPDLSTTMVPRVMFTATFDPPMVLPQNEWSRLFFSAGLSPPNMQLNSRGTPPTYDSLFFPIPVDAKVDAYEPRSLSRRRLVRSFDNDSQTLCTHHTNTLYIYKPIYSQVLSEIPFSHPRQLMDMLPVLRQYAFLSQLLEKSFGSQTSVVPNIAPSATTAAHVKPSFDFANHNDRAAPHATNSAVKPQASSPVAPTKDRSPISRVDAILWVHPSPHIHIVLPAVTPTFHATFRILEGGTVEILDENVAGRNISKAKMARALELFEDLNKWVEWMWAHV